jgi:hypothetical protein
MRGYWLFKQGKERKKYRCEWINESKIWERHKALNE